MAKKRLLRCKLVKSGHEEIQTQDKVRVLSPYLVESWKLPRRDILMDGPIKALPLLRGVKRRGRYGSPMKP